MTLNITATGGGFLGFKEFPLDHRLQSLDSQNTQPFLQIEGVFNAKTPESPVNVAPLTANNYSITTYCIPSPLSLPFDKWTSNSTPTSQV